MVDNPNSSDQEDFEFVQNLFEQIKPEFASPELKAEILRSAPSAESTNATVTGLEELIEYLWPFGPLWRPAAGLAIAAMFGVMLGATDPLSPNTVADADTALTEEIVAFVEAADGQLEDIQ
jgi:hypothetical protein